MPWQDGTVTVDDVAGHVRAPADDRMQTATEVATFKALRRHGRTDPAVVFLDADVWDGTVRYAGLLWRSGAATAGFASYQPTTEADYTEFARAMDHIGSDPVLA